MSELMFEHRKDREAREREQQAMEMARLIADQLHASVLKIPAEFAEALKEFNGWTTRVHITGDQWAPMLETQIMADGGIRLRVTTANGQPILDRVFSP